MKQVKEGAQGGNMPGKEGHRATGKSNHPEATLRNGSKPSGNSLAAFGLKQSPHEEAPSGESNHETRRFGNKPSAEKVKPVSHDKATLSRARMLNVRSEKGGAEKGGGW
jgi:hypothetical protein